MAILSYIRHSSNMAKSHYADWSPFASICINPIVAEQIFCFTAPFPKHNNRHYASSFVAASNSKQQFRLFPRSVSNYRLSFLVTYMVKPFPSDKYLIKPLMPNNKPKNTSDESVHCIPPKFPLINKWQYHDSINEAKLMHWVVIASP